MIPAAVFHRATDSWCYPLDERRLHIRLATALGDVEEVLLRSGDPHEWQRPALEGGAWTWKSSLLPLRESGTDGQRSFWEIILEPPYRRLRYSFLLRSGSQWFEYGEEGLFPAESEPGSKGEPAFPGIEHKNSFVFPYINEIDLYRAPTWVRDTVWYQIFPDRFRIGNPNKLRGTKAWGPGPVSNRDFYGGDLRGIAEKLDHLVELGVNGIYLTPIFASPSVHKYDTTDYLRIDSAFGDDEDLRLLVEGCHARGIRLILDAVFNHSGSSFGPWKDVVEKGSSSPYADWFHVRSWPLFPKGRDTGDSRDSGFETFSFTTRMPKLNTANPELRDYLLGVAERYIRDFDIDGWRLDVANEVDHDFWRTFRARVKALKPEAYIVGEIWHDSMPWLRGDQYDAVMNYPYGNAISDFLLAKRGAPDAQGLQRRLARIDFSYPLPVIRHNFNLLDSHDTDRLVNRMGGDLALARLGWLLLFLLPGSPCIYYGTEYGLEGGGDPDNRRCMPWDEALQDQGQFAFMKALIALRRSRSELFAVGRREFRFLEARPGFLFLGIGEGSERLVALVNRDESELPAELLDEMLATGGLGEAIVLLEDPREPSSERAVPVSPPPSSAALGPRSFRILGQRRA